MLNHCIALMGSLPWLGWIIPIAMFTLLGLGIAALAKYLFTSSRTSRELPEGHS